MISGVNATQTRHIEKKLNLINYWQRNHNPRVGGSSPSSATTAVVSLLGLPQVASRSGR
jgi:hypothetical protein